jgi:hypothetical protein
VCISHVTFGPNVQILDVNCQCVYHRSIRTERLPSIVSSLRLASVATLPFQRRGNCLVHEQRGPGRRSR